MCLSFFFSLFLVSAFPIKYERAKDAPLSRHCFVLFLFFLCLFVWIHILFLIYFLFILFLSLLTGNTARRAQRFDSWSRPFSGHLSVPAAAAVRPRRHADHRDDLGGAARPERRADLRHSEARLLPRQQVSTAVRCVPDVSLLFYYCMCFFHIFSLILFL